MPRQAFLEELSRLGPGAPPAGPMPLEMARDYCWRLARTHYENFAVVSWLTPRELRPHFCALYAWCRWADDLSDEIGDSQQALKLLAWWESQLALLYATGQATHPVYVALRPTIAEFDLPQNLFLNLLSAFKQDQWKTRYETFEELIAYCRYSANPVGRLVLHVARCHRDDTGRLADNICTGLQLANFWQDVAADYDRGRVYLPREHLAHFDISEADLAQRYATPAFRKLLSQEVTLARKFLDSGVPLVELVPSTFSVPVRLFIDGGLAILEAIERQKYDVWSRRPRLSRLAKLRLMWNAWWSTGGQ